MSIGRVLMVQGSSSSVGKSLLVAALCRIFARRGLRVAPFKAQNMSNNAAVCSDGAEIGRSQALQAAAAEVAPTADMNPVLLKPEAGGRPQVVVLGRVWRTLPATSSHEHKRFLWQHITSALGRLRAAYELVVIEGAGSPAELNLTAGDIVNMAVARHARAPVLLVGDIDRGGVFAQLLGTLWLLPPEERALVRGLIVNKFRGDPALFTDGVRILEDRSGVPVLGVIPYLAGLQLPEEDAVALEVGSTTERPAAIDIAVVRLPLIANFDDFDALRAEPGVQVRYVAALAQLGQPDAVILPGTKSTLADLRWLREQGLADAVAHHARRGGAVVGVCGGYQMLGRAIRDPHGAESVADEAPGLGLLPVETAFAADKATHQVRVRIAAERGWLVALNGAHLSGYEIHLGRTVTAAPWLEIVERGGIACGGTDGAVSPDGRVWGCYLHGLFGNDEFRRAWLASLRPNYRAVPMSAAQRLQDGLNQLADAVAAALPVPRLEQLVAEGVTL